MSDLDISASIAFHKNHGKLVTVTAVQPPARFGGLGIDGTTDQRVPGKARRAKADGSTAASLSLSPAVMERFPMRARCLNREPMQSLTAKKQVQAFFHRGFWQPMDTLRDKQRLEELWASGRAPWKTW